MPDDEEPTSQALVPLQERNVDFYGDQVLAVLVAGRGHHDPPSEIYMPLRPIVENLGLDWKSQRSRLRRDPILRDAVTPVSVQTEGGQQDMLAVPLKYLPGWLFGVDAGRVKSELREKVLHYRRECFDVLWRAFQGEALRRRPVPGEETLLQVRNMGLAIVALAEQQLELQRHQAESDSRLDEHQTRLDRAAEAFKALERRQTAIERRIVGGAVVSEEQAAEISNRVKALAEYLTSKEPNQVHYQTIFGELYRRFGVSSYLDFVHFMRHRPGYR